MKRFLFILIALSLALACAIAFGLRAYHVFTGEELVAVAECLPAPPGSGFDFQIKLIPKIGSTKLYGLSGEQWLAGGEYLKWHPWLNLVGVKNRYKLTRLQGRYIRASAEVQKPRTAYELSGGTDPAWLLLYKLQGTLPFVSAVYGNAAYTMADRGGTWGIYVGNSGYVVRRIRPSQR